MKDITILGSKITVASWSEILSIFERWIKEDSTHQVCVANVHTTILGMDDTAFQHITNFASIVTMDGRPLVWAVKIRGEKEAERITGLI